MDKVRIGSTVVLLLVAAVVLWRFVVIVPAGSTGVHVLFGQVSENERSSGLHFVLPIARVVPMSIRTEEYTMSIAEGEGERFGADSITALTSEGLKVDLDITVFYRLIEDQAANVYETVGLDYEEKIIRPEIRSGIREVISQYDAKALYSDKRTEASDRILESLQASLEPRGITVEDVLLRNIQLPDSLQASIEQKLSAEQEAERMEFVVERERLEAERKRVEAEGQRDAQAIINQSLTPDYLQYLYVQNLQDREGTIYVPTNPNNGVPLFRGLP